MENRRSYPIFIVFNGRVFNEVLIDPHYEENHSKYMSDDFILRLVKKLNRSYAPVQERVKGWDYHEIDRVEGDGRLYRIVICTSEIKNYIGVINCYRRGS